MAVEPVARDFAVGEEPDEREVAEGLADYIGLDPRFAEERHAARDAADINAGLGRAAKTPGELFHHARQILLGALGVAAAEHDRVARRHLGAEHDPTLAWVDRHQI